MQIFAKVENDTIKLPPGIHLPDGTTVRVEAESTAAAGQGWPPGYFESTAGALTGEPFERSPQGELRPIGLADGEFIVPESFDDPLPDEILEAFEGK